MHRIAVMMHDIDCGDSRILNCAHLVIFRPPVSGAAQTQNTADHHHPYGVLSSLESSLTNADYWD